MRWVILVAGVAIAALAAWWVFRGFEAPLAVAAAGAAALATTRRAQRYSEQAIAVNQDYNRTVDAIETAEVEPEAYDERRREWDVGDWAGRERPGVRERS